jgi:hypothetical protein
MERSKLCFGFLIEHSQAPGLMPQPSFELQGCRTRNIVLHINKDIKHKMEIVACLQFNTIPW